MPIQPNGFDCGYYVARYMSDIIVQGSQQRTIPQVLYMYYYALISCISFIQKIYNELQYYKFSACKRPLFLSSNRWSSASSNKWASYMFVLVSLPFIWLSYIICMLCDTCVVLFIVIYMCCLLIVLCISFYLCVGCIYAYIMHICIYANIMHICIYANIMHIMLDANIMHIMCRLWYWYHTVPVRVGTKKN